MSIIHHWYSPEGLDLFVPNVYCAGTHQWTAHALSNKIYLARTILEVPS